MSLKVTSAPSLPVQPHPQIENHAVTSEEIAVATDVPKPTLKLETNKIDIREFLLQPRSLDIGTKVISWNMGDLLQKLLTYFSKNFRGTQAQLISGIYYLAGKERWNNSLQEWLQKDRLPDCTTPEMWSFCTKPPACFEMQVHIPFQRLASEESLTLDEELQKFKEEFQTFLNLTTFLIASQSLPEPLSYVNAMALFNRVRESVEGTADLLEIMKGIKAKSQLTYHVHEGRPIATIEVPLNQETRFKIHFSFPPLKPETPDRYLKLYLQGDEHPAVELVCGVPYPLETLYEQIRLSQSWVKGSFPRADNVHYKNAYALGCRFLQSSKDALMVFYFNVLAHDIEIPLPPNDETVPQTALGLFLYSHLVATPRPIKEVAAALTLATHFNEGAALPILVPDDVQAALELLAQKVKDNESCLSLISDALKATCPDVSLEMALETLITDEDNKISSLAWQLWGEKIKDSLSRLKSLLRLCPDLKKDPMPTALGKVQNLCRTAKDVLQPAQLVGLLSAYLDRLVQINLLSDAEVLVDNLDALVLIDLQLLNHVLPHRQAVGHLAAHPKSKIAAFLIRRLEDAWKDFQNFQRHPKKDVMQSFLETLENTLASYGSLLTSKKGFATPFFEWVATTLKGKGDYRRILSLLRYIPVPVGDRIFHTLYEKSLEHLMNVKTVRSAEWATELAYFRETKAYCLAPSEFLLKLVEHLLKISKEAKTTKAAAKVRRELSFFIDQIKHDLKGTDRFLTCLFAYYSLLLDRTLLGQLLDDLVKNFPLLKADSRAGQLLMSSFEILKQTKDTKQWEKFAACLELFKKESKFNETVLSIYESNDISVTDRIFRTEWAAFEKRLNDSQRVRLAKVLVALYRHHPEALSYFPSAQWFLTLIEREETLASYTEFYLDLATKKKIEPTAPSLLKVGVSLTTDADLRTFGKLVTRIPQSQFRAQAAEWKPLLARVISRFPSEPFTLDLLNILIAIAAPEEKRFLEECKSIRAEPERLQGAMSGFPAKREIPPCQSLGQSLGQTKAEALGTALQRVQSRLDGLISVMMSFESLERMLKDVESSPGFEHWEVFFDYLHRELPDDLLLRAWKLWLQQHPPDQALLQDGKYWLAAVQKLLSLYLKSDLVDEFLTNDPEKKISDLLALVSRLEGEECKPLFIWFLEKGINSCWINRSEDKLRVLFHLIKMETLATKFGTPPLLLLTPEMQLRLSLLLASYPPGSLDGQKHFFALTQEAVSGLFPRSVHEHIFARYCERPFVPKDVVLQSRLYRWIESGLILLPALSWDAAATLIPALCCFDSCIEKNLPDDIVMKWQLMTQRIAAEKSIPRTFGIFPMGDLSKIISQSPVAAAIPSDAFLESTCVMLDMLLDLDLPPKNKQDLLLTIGESLQLFQQEFLGIGRMTPLWTSFMQAALTNIPVDTPTYKSVIMIVMKHISINLPSVRTTDAFKKYRPVIKAFIGSMRPILILSAGDAKYIESVMSVITTLSTFPEIINDKEDGWLFLLVNLTRHMHRLFSKMPKEHSTMIHKAAIKLFARCTNLQMVQQIPTLTYEYQNRLYDDRNWLICYTSMVLTAYLSYPDLECLDLEDWNNLFMGMAERTMRGMIDECLKDGNTIGLVRVLHHAKPYNSEFLDLILTAAADLDPKEPATVTVAIRSIIQKYKDIARPDQMEKLKTMLRLLLSQNLKPVESVSILRQN